MSRRTSKAVPFARPPHRRRSEWRFVSLTLALALATFTAVFLHGLPTAAAFGSAGAAVLPASASPPRAALADAGDTVRARFDLCSGPVRVNCVVDGDTIWIDRRKIRLADINAPETHEADCPQELALGTRATQRLLVLLNQGPFTLAANDDGTGRDEDQYGRELRVVTRGGASVGEELVAEGLAEEWKGYRSSWC